ncbi:MAG: phage shock protein E [Cryomorphaceae bacterium]
MSGAKNIPYTHFTRDTLEESILSKDTKILIYCRNDFYVPSLNTSWLEDIFPVTPSTATESTNEYELPTDYEPPELMKTARTELNIPTFITLLSYGYENIWELDDVVNPNESVIDFYGKITAEGQ